MASLSDFFNKVEMRIIEAHQEILQNASQELVDILPDNYEKYVARPTVASYYNEWKPKRYVRRGDLYNTIDLISNMHGSKICLHLDLDASKLGDFSSGSAYHKSIGDKEPSVDVLSDFYDSEDDDSEKPVNTWIPRSDKNFSFANSSNGVVSTDWIFANFLAGIHPIYVVNKKNKRSRTVINKSVKTTDVETNLNIYENKFKPRMFGLIITSIKKQCANYF